MDNKELAEQWRELPHNIAGIVEKMIHLKWGALPSREDINDNWSDYQHLKYIFMRLLQLYRYSKGL